MRRDHHRGINPTVHEGDGDVVRESDEDDDGGEKDDGHEGDAGDLVSEVVRLRARIRCKP